MAEVYGYTKFEHLSKRLMLVDLKQVKILYLSSFARRYLSAPPCLVDCNDYFLKLATCTACFQKPAKSFSFESQNRLFVAQEYRDLGVLRILFAVVSDFLFLSSCWSWCYISFFLFVKVYSVLILINFFLMFIVNSVQKLSQYTNYNLLLIVNH